MKKCYWLLLVFVVGTNALGATTNDAIPVIQRAVMVDALVVAQVWSGHPVDFAVLAGQPHQFVAFYDDQRQLTVARRRLDERRWTFVKLPDVTGWDSHNSIALAADDDGCLHVSADMHVAPLKYFRATKPWDVATLTRVEQMVGHEENRCTYPGF